MREIDPKITTAFIRQVAADLAIRYAALKKDLATSGLNPREAEAAAVSTAVISVGSLEQLFLNQAVLLGTSYDHALEMCKAGAEMCQRSLDTCSAEEAEPAAYLVGMSSVAKIVLGVGTGDPEFEMPKPVGDN